MQFVNAVTAEALPIKQIQQLRAGPGLFPHRDYFLKQRWVSVPCFHPCPCRISVCSKDIGRCGRAVGRRAKWHTDGKPSEKPRGAESGPGCPGGYPTIQKLLLDDFRSKPASLETPNEPQLIITYN